MVRPLSLSSTSPLIVARYGDYQQYPEEPTVGTPAYQPIIYDTWDPNWRGFIGIAFIIALEEFAPLIPADVVQLMHASLYNNTVGDSYRVGGVDGDNLYPSYTNPVPPPFPPPPSLQRRKTGS